MEFSTTLIVKVVVLSIISIYIVFAFVILKQVNLMTKTLEVGFEAPIKLVALIHFLLALGTLFIAFTIL